MAKLPSITKNPGDPHTAAEFNLNTTSLNALYDALFALGIIGTIKEAALPSVYFSGISGAGTLNNPYVITGSGGQASPEEWLRSLPGYTDIEDKILYINAGAFSWGAVPSGSLEKLDTPVLTIGSAAVDSFPLSWGVIVNATSYTLQRDTQASFATVVTVYNGPLRVFTDSGLVASTTYYYRLRANAAGFAASNFATGSEATLATGNITPPSPTNPVVDDSNDFFNWTNATGYANITNYEYTLDGGTTYAQATVKPIIVGNIFKAIGQVGVRVKADTGRNASGTLFNPTAFNTAAVKAAKPTNPITNDVDNLFNWTDSAGFANIFNYEYTLNGGTTYTTCTEKPVFVGDVTKAIGQVGVRVKAASGVIASDTLFNTVAFSGTDGFTNVTAWLDIAPAVRVDNDITSTEDARGRTVLKLSAGQVGSVRVSSCKGGSIILSTAPTGLDGNSDSQTKYYFQQNPINLKTQAFARANSLNTETPALSGPDVTEVELTATDVNFYYGVSKQLWASTPRAAGEDLYLKMAMGGGGELLNIVQKGFA